VKLVLTHHAKRRMRERSVSVDELIAAFCEPEQLVYDRMRDTYLLLGANGVALVYVMRGYVYEIVSVLRRREYEALVRRIGSRRYKVIF